MSDVCTCGHLWDEHELGGGLCMVVLTDSDVDEPCPCVLFEEGDD